MSIPLEKVIKNFFNDKAPGEVRIERISNDTYLINVKKVNTRERIKVYEAVSNVVTNEIERHVKQEKELEYSYTKQISYKDNTLITELEFDKPQKAKVKLNIIQCPNHMTEMVIKLDKEDNKEQSPVVNDINKKEDSASFIDNISKNVLEELVGTYDLIKELNKYKKRKVFRLVAYETEKEYFVL